MSSTQNPFFSKKEPKLSTKVKDDLSQFSNYMHDLGCRWGCGFVNIWDGVFP